MFCGSASKTSCWEPEVFLVGGGPSLRDAPLERLQGRFVVAINDVAACLPWATALFSLDPVWIEERRSLIVNFPGERYLAPPPGIPRDIPGVNYLEPRYDLGLSDDPQVVHTAGTSGYGALNLAYLKGARRIILLGYDYCTVPGATHWYRNDRVPPADDILKQWAAGYRSMLPQLERAGVEVINTSLISAIDAFPKIPLEEVLR